MVVMDENEDVKDRDGNAPVFPTTGIEDSQFGINYRSEPLRNRLRAVLEHRGAARYDSAADGAVKVAAGEPKTVTLPSGRIIKPRDHFCDGYVPDLDTVVADPGAKCISEESHLQSWVFGDEGKLTRTVDERQTVKVEGASGGTFVLGFKGSATGPIPFDAGPAAVETALEGVGGIAGGDVHVSGQAASSAPGLTVEFTGALAGRDVPQLTADGGGLTPASGASAPADGSAGASGAGAPGPADGSAGASGAGAPGPADGSAGASDA